MRMTVIGCGHLGATHAACMAEIGHDVLGVDIDDDKIVLLNSGKAWFHEPGLDAMLERNITAGRLRFTTSFAAATKFADVHFLGVATPGHSDGSYDLSQVRHAALFLAEHLAGPALIIGKSTVPPGTAAMLQRLLADHAPAAEVAWNPEFLREGHAVKDTLRPDRIVIGTAGTRARTRLRAIYRPLAQAGVPVVYTDLATAELAKAAANAFLATKITFINTMADVCTATGADVSMLATTLGMDPRIGAACLKAGIGYGGACLPKDVRGLAAFAGQVGTHSAERLLTLIDQANTERRELVIKRVRAVTGDDGARLHGKRVAMWGAAFKAGTDDVRDSPALDVADRLHDLGARVTVHDPMAVGSAITAYPHLGYADSPLAAARDADVVVVATAWAQFADVRPADAARAGAARTIVDACGVIDAAAWRAAGWRVSSLT